MTGRSLKFVDDVKGKINNEYREGKENIESILYEDASRNRLQVKPPKHLSKGEKSVWRATRPFLDRYPVGNIDSVELEMYCFYVNLLNTIRKRLEDEDAIIEESGILELSKLNNEYIKVSKEVLKLKKLLNLDMSSKYKMMKELGESVVGIDEEEEDGEEEGNGLGVSI